MTTDPDLGLLYREARERVIGVVRGLTTEEVAAPVPACPGWSVHDVVARMTATAEDALAGRLTGPPSVEWTAEQVARFRDEPVRGLLAKWADLGPQFEEVISGLKVWPGVIDAVSHEHDIRGAVSRPGDRDSSGVRESADAVLRWFEPPVPMVVHVGDATLSLGPVGDRPLELTTTRFEALRIRMGRRSRGQATSMNWSDDPSAVLDARFVFGPAEADVLE